MSGALLIFGTFSHGIVQFLRRSQRFHVVVVHLSLYHARRHLHIVRLLWLTQVNLLVEAAHVGVLIEASRRVRAKEVTLVLTVGVEWEHLSGSRDASVQSVGYLDRSAHRISLIIVAERHEVVLAAEHRCLLVSLLQRQEQVGVFSLEAGNDLRTLRLHDLVVAEQVNEHLLVLRLKHANADRAGVRYFNLVSAYLETLRVRQHREHAPRANVLPHLFKLANKQLVQFIVDAVARLATALLQHLDLFLSLLLQLILQVLDDSRLPDAVMEEEALDLLGEPVDTHVHFVESFNEVLQLHVLKLLDGLNDAGTEMSLHLQLVRLLILFAFHCFLFERDRLQFILLFFFGLVKNTQQLLAL